MPHCKAFRIFCAQTLTASPELSIINLCFVFLEYASSSSKRTVQDVAPNSDLEQMMQHSQIAREEKGSSSGPFSREGTLDGLSVAIES